MLETFRRIRVLVGGGRRGRWAAVIVLAIVVAGLEAIGALLIFLLISLLADAAGAVAVPLLGDVRDLLPGRDDADLLVTVGVAVAAFSLLRGVLLLVQHYVQYRVVENASARLSTRLFDGYLAMPATFHLERNSSVLVRNAISSVQRVVQEGLVPGVQVVAKLAVVAGITAVLLLTSPLAALAAAVALGGVTAVVVALVQPRVKRWGRTVQTMAERNIQAVQQGLEGWRDIRILGRQPTFVARFDRDRHRLAQAIYLGRTVAELPRVVIETGVVVAIAAFVVGSVLAEGAASGALPVLGLFGYAAVRLMPELSSIAANVNALRFVRPAVDDIHADLERFRREAAPASAPAAPLPLHDAIRLEDVTFHYAGTTVPALRDVDVRIAAGASVGIVGPTGGGKSTLVDLVLGLLEPTSGRVTVDGEDIRDHLPAWHAAVGMVPQQVFVADDTVRRNIALGVPDEEIDDRLVAEVVRLAQLEDVVRELPAGLDTVVGERGARISGGQRQRLAIARALYRRPAVLVLDEGTSALDTATEAALVAALAREQGRRTLLTVAHRLSTVQRCDEILLVRDGAVADRGTYAALVARNPSLRTAPA